MTNRFCTDCGAESPGRFCGACGSAQGTERATSLLGAALPITPQVRELGKLEIWGARVERCFSIRLWLASLFAGALLGTLAGAAWDPLSMPVTIGVFLVAFIGTLVNDEQMMKCDACRKRVKLGATACHHCGYSRNAV